MGDKMVQDIKADVVPGMLILEPNIAQSNNQKFVHKKSPMIASWGCKDNRLNLFLCLVRCCSSFFLLQLTGHGY